MMAFSPALCQTDKSNDGRCPLLSQDKMEDPSGWQVQHCGWGRLACLPMSLGRSSAVCVWGEDTACGTCWLFRSSLEVVFVSSRLHLRESWGSRHSWRSGKKFVHGHQSELLAYCCLLDLSKGFLIASFYWNSSANLLLILSDKMVLMAPHSARHHDMLKPKSFRKAPVHWWSQQP